jgi:hypothetical protein
MAIDSASGSVGWVPRLCWRTARFVSPALPRMLVSLDTTVLGVAAVLFVYMDTPAGAVLAGAAATVPGSAYVAWWARGLWSSSPSREVSAGFSCLIAPSRASAQHSF